MTRVRPHIPLTDEFVGESDFLRYSALVAETSTQEMGNNPTTTYPWGLSTQDHINIRTFNAANAQYPEYWTNSTSVTFSTGPKTYLNNWNALVTTVDGVTSYTSIAGKLDLTSLGTNASVILALPNWPIVYVNANQTFLDFSSDNFATYASVSFDQSVTPLLNGDSVATWPIGMFTGTDLTQVTGVRIRVSNYDAATLMFAGLRLIGPQWIAADVDIDNWNGAIHQAIPPNGQRGGFPVATNKQLPRLWYSAPTSGVDDPQPINATMGSVFNTGSMLFSNSLSIFMRGVGGTDTSQLAINGLTQAALTGPQPGLTTSTELPRRVADIQGLSMKQLSGQEVLQLSERADHVATSWITFNLTWGSGIPSVGVTSSVTGNGYTWSGIAASAIANLSPNTFYLCLCSLQDTAAQLQILALNQTNYSILTTSAPLFDTGPIRDSYLFPRRRGRIGWQTNLLDGDAQIRAIRPHALTYAEYRSTPLNSNTPVKGARIYTQFAPHETLWRSWSPLADPNGVVPTLTLDTGRYDANHPDHQSTRVDISTPSVGILGQGLISNVLTPADDALSGIVDWANAQVALSLWMPPEALVGAPTLSISLFSQDGYSIPLTVPGLAPGTWQRLILYPPTLPPGFVSNLQSGRYQLLIRYSGLGTSFWVDNVQVVERTTTWAARANPADPWVEFDDLIASDDAGILINPGSALQVRGLAHRQDEVILAPPRVVPMYARLGRLVWPEDAGIDPNVTSPGISWSSVITGRQVTFTANPGAWTSNVVSNYVWALGDGRVASGQRVTHTYIGPGVYTVTLTATDNFGTPATYAGTVSLS